MHKCDCYTKAIELCRTFVVKLSTGLSLAAIGQLDNKSSTQFYRFCVEIACVHNDKRKKNVSKKAINYLDSHELVRTSVLNHSFPNFS